MEVKMNSIPIINTSSIDIQSCDETITVTSAPVNVHQLKLSVTKVASCPVAVVGGTIKYCVTIKNATGVPVFGLMFRDVLDQHVSYKAGSFTVNGIPADPIITGQTITYLIHEIGNDQEVTICFKVDVNSWPE
jgi:uncharacterized repeat protein (TIGR01451 family)